jgi:hypothetical protein
VRSTPVFAAAVNVTVAPLAPVAGANVNHVALDDADQDDWFVVTVTGLVPPA